MSIYKCKMCGGTIDVQEGQNVVTCEFCGTTQTVHSFDNEKKTTYFRRAEALRYKCEFDKAAGIYETIVSEFPKEAEAYWGLVLCKFGIEYVNDPKTGFKIPTCHRTRFESIFEDSDFKNVIKYADIVARIIYEKEAKEISKLQKAILDISSKEDAFDIFICYKETDKTGERTKDSVLAQDIYEELTNEGFRVFFSRITLEDKLGSQYEPYIFAALHSSKVMLHVTTSNEHSESVWVRNEWSRYLSLIQEGQKKTLIPCYKGITAYDLPDEMQNLQGQDMSKIGSMQDLIRGINKIIGKNKKVNATFYSTGDVSINAEQEAFEAQIRKGYVYLSKKMFKDAEETFNNAVKLVEKCGRAYIGLMLAEAKEITIDNYLKHQGYGADNIDKLEIARSFADDKCLNELDDIYAKIDKMEYEDICNFFDNLLKNNKWDEAKDFLTKSEKDKYYGELLNLYKESLYLYASKLINQTITVKDSYQVDYAIKYFTELCDYKDSKEKINVCNKLKTKAIENYNNECINKLLIRFSEEINIKTLSDVVSKLIKNKEIFESFKPETDLIRKAFNDIQNNGYKFIESKSYDLINQFSSLTECSKLTNLIYSLKYDDFFKNVLEAIKIKESYIKDVEKQVKRKKTKTRLKITGIICATLAMAVGVFFGIKGFIDETNRDNTYKSGLLAMESGNYDDAIAYYESLGNYKESKNKIKVCEGLKKLRLSVSLDSEQYAIDGIKKIVSGSEKVEVSYESEKNTNIKRVLKPGENSGNKIETIDSIDFSLYQPTWGGYTFLKWSPTLCDYKDGKACLSLLSNWSRESYTITYHLDGGTNNPANPNAYTVESEDITLLNPSKTNYQFLGWLYKEDNGNKINLIPKGTFGNITLYAKWEINKYSVKFYNGNNLLYTDVVEHGGTARYVGSTPAKEKDAQYTYTFNGWDKTLTNVTSNFSTYAQYSTQLNSYTVKFFDYDKRTLLDRTVVQYGSCATYTKATPTRQADEDFEYKFSCWDKPLSTKIIRDTNFYAEYSTTNRYLCRFFNENVLLYSIKVTEGNSVSYIGLTPTKPATQQYVYTFNGWDKSLNNISSNTDFFAQFSNTTNKYTVTFVNWDGAILGSSTVDYGTKATYKGNTPTRSVDNDFAYTFNGWDISLDSITDNVTATAQYSTTNRYLVIFQNYDGVELFRQFVTEGETAVYGGAIPTKPTTQQYTYTFSGWDKSLTNIDRMTVFSAQFRNTTNKYTVTFVNWDGTVLGSSTVDYGTLATYDGDTPTKPTDNIYKYTFSGWDISLDSITDNVTATAQYSTTNRYLVSFQNYDGTLLYSEYVTEGENAHYVGNIPTKPTTQQYSYTFSGWDKSLENVSCHFTVTALYTYTINKYTVTFVNYDGEILGSDTVDYGASAIYEGVTPTKPEYRGCSFSFKTWDISLENITDNVTATAQYYQYVNDITYELSDNKSGYIITGYSGSATELELVSSYNELPVIEIGPDAFIGKGVQTIYLPDSIKKIGKSAFAGSNICNVKFLSKSNLTTIEERAFANADNLWDTTNVRADRSLTGFIIPASVTNLASNAFYHYYNFGNDSFYGPPDRKVYCIECNFSKSYIWGDWQYRYYAGSLGYEIADGSFKLYLYSDISYETNFGLWKYSNPEEQTGITIVKNAKS